MKYLLKVLLTPSCWLQNETYCEVLDKKLLNLLKTENFKYLTDRTIQIGDLTLWIGNHPYASFTAPFKDGLGRPSRRTILRSMDKLRADYFNTNTNTN